MAAMKIPSVLSRGFIVISKLNVEERNKLIEVIKNSKIGASHLDFETEIIKEIGLDAKDSKNAVGVLFSFIGLKEELFESSNVSIIDLINGIKEIEGLTLNNGFEVFIENLIESTNSKSLIASKKARRLILDRSNIFNAVEIFTDIRPVFGGDDNLEIDAISLLYNLNISFSKASNLDEEAISNLTIAMDGEDLIKLKEIIERAEQKAKVIQDKFYDNIPVVRS